MFQDLFIPDETEYNRETERNIAEAILDHRLEMLEAMQTLIDWCLQGDSETGLSRPCPEMIVDLASLREWYRREGRAWRESKTEA